MASPYLNAGTDGADLGVNYATWYRETQIARTGDRRGQTRTLWTGTVGTCAAAYPSYLSLTFPVPTGGVFNVTAGSGSSLQTQINAAAAAGGGYVVVPGGTANRISTGTITLPVVSGGSTTPGGNNVVIIIGKPIYDAMNLATGESTLLPLGLRVVSANQVLRIPTLTATDVESFAHIQGSGLTTADAVFDTGSNVANGYRYCGLYVTSDPSHTSTTATSRVFRIGTGNSTQNSDALTPKNHCWDRTIVTTSHLSTQILHLVDVHARGILAIDSDFSGVWETGNGDSQAFLFYNTNGDVALINNYFEASDEGVGTGGAGNSVGGLANVEHRWNVYGKRDSWNPAHASYDNTQGRPAWSSGTTYNTGVTRVSAANLSYRSTAVTWSSGTTYTAGQRVNYSGADYAAAQSANTNHLPTDPVWWTADPNLNKAVSNTTYWTVEPPPSVKLSQEIKAGQKVLVAGCLHIGCWPGLQNGDGINIKHNYVEVAAVPTQDIILRDCAFEKLGTGIRIAGNADDSAPPSVLYAVHRVAVFNCVGTTIGGSTYDSGGNFGEWMRSSSVEGLWVDHCTAFPARVDHLLIGSTPSPTPGDSSDGLTNSYVQTNCIFGGPTSFAYFRGGGTGDGKATLDTYAPSATLTANVITGATSGNYSGAPLAGNFFPATESIIQFDPANGIALLGTTQGLPGGMLKSRVMMVFRH